MNPILTTLVESTNSKRYEEVFSLENLNQLSQSSNFIRRSRKMTALAFVHLCSFMPSTRSYPSIEEMRGELYRLWGTLMSKSSLFARFSREAVSFMHLIFKSVLKVELKQVSQGPYLNLFSDIIVLDSTIINLSGKCRSVFRGCGGGASLSSSKIQFNLGLFSGQIQELSLLPGCQGDAAYRLDKISPEVLYLFDLGYACVDNFQAIMKGKAYFLTRYRYKSTLFRPDGQVISRRALDRLVRRLKPGKRFDIEILYTHKKIPSRLILQKLPQQIGDQIRRKLKTDKQKKCKNLSKERLAFCDVNAYITNLRADQLPAKYVRTTYAIRWQVEIWFKAWKSMLELDKTRNLGANQFQCCLYGGLIRMILSLRIFHQAKWIQWKEKQKELSELKAMAIFAARKNEMAAWLISKKMDGREFLSEIWKILSVACNKDKKRKKTQEPASTTWEFILLNP